MQVLYGALAIALILYGACSRCSGFVASLRSYLSCLTGIKSRSAHQNSESITKTPCTSEPESIDDRKDDGRLSDAAPANHLTAPSPTSFYALIIGINNYPNLDRLKGAAADAERVASFLVTDLQVPLDHIINLRNESATREAIIGGLLRLRDDPRIATGDPILIYFAGHGGSTKTRKRQGSGTIVDEVQVIFPHDYGVRNDGSDEPVNCIPDYTIAGLLNALAEAKGDNITVVFDSCHSASGSRDGYEVPTAPLPRSAPILYDIPSDIDANVLKTAPNRARMSRGIDPVFRTDHASHVLLAACGSREKAWEQDQRGQFTSALLKTFKASGVENLTYHNLLVSLPKLTNQSPHCYGSNKSRTLFDSRVSSLRSAYIPVTLEKGTLVLAAGVSSGITHQSIWELHESTNDSPSLGRFVAEMPRIVTTALSPETDEVKQSIQSTPMWVSGDQRRLYARQVGAGVGNELKVWFSSQATEMLLRPNDPEEESRVTNPPRNEVGYLPHLQEGADIGVEVDDSKSELGKREAVFSLFDPLAERCNVSRLEQRKPANRGEVEAVLFSAAKWNWHLRRTNPQHAEDPRQSVVGMEMYKIAKKTLRNRREFLETPELVPIDYDVSDTTGVVDLVASDRDLYGVKLTNKRSVPLYVKVFFFDATDFSIAHLFGHTVSIEGDPELPGSGELIVGDGTDGGPPLKFTIPPGKKIELGYLKVFWSTDPLELDDIPQASAFKLKSTRGIKKHAKGKAMKDWGTVCLALVQRSP